MKKAEYWIKKPGLARHPEGGWFRQVYKSVDKIPKEHLPERFRGDRIFSTSIYFLLSGEEFSAFHRIKSDELWHFYNGSGVIIHMIDKNENYSSVVIGSDAENGEAFQYAVPHGVWFASELRDKNSFALVGCTVSPGFAYEDFELGKRQSLIDNFPIHKELIHKMTRS